MTMSELIEIDQELVNVTLQTLTSLLSPALMEQGQQHLKVLQIRKGSIYDQHESKILS